MKPFFQSADGCAFFRIGKRPHFVKVDRELVAVGVHDFAHCLKVGFQLLIGGLEGESGICHIYKCIYFADKRGTPSCALKGGD